MRWLPRLRPQFNTQLNTQSDKHSNKTQSAFLLPLKDTILLPTITLPVIAGRPHSAASVTAAMNTANKQLVIATLRPETLERLTTDHDADVETLDDVYPIATLAVVRRMVQLPKGLIQLIVEGVERVELEHLRITAKGCFKVTFHRLPLPNDDVTVDDDDAPGENGTPNDTAPNDTTTNDTTTKALTDAIKVLWAETASINPNFPDDLLDFLIENDDPIHLAYHSVILMQQDVPESQAILAENSLNKLLRQVLTALQKYVETYRLRTQLLGETKEEIEEQQRQFFLRQQLKTIQAQLGEGDPDQEEIAELKAQLADTALPAATQKQISRELGRLERVGSSSAEGGVIRTYLDWLLEMPWTNTVEDNLDLQNARTVLDADHYGLAKVKDRIIEHLATFKLKRQAHQRLMESRVGANSLSEDLPREDVSDGLSGDLSGDLSGIPPYAVGTVLCFSGPPGVGKTSLGRSIARALGRPFERISLGGLRDEAELRGHRRTYIGAMPGRIIQAIHRAGAKNPVIMLDELDKVGMDYRGDPASVLLEILDPQQNYCFHDLYLDLEFDLSQVIFIGTANDLAAVSAPLLDRLELIELSGYSDQEKQAIARTYLLPRQLEKSGLPSDALQLNEETLRRVIEGYTREAGVRHLEQQLGSLCRKVAVKFAAGETTPITLHPEELETVLGPKQYVHEAQRSHPQPGVATGLAWTLSGGEVLFVEAVLLPQGKALTLTGQLGDVMEESVQIARSYIWAHAQELGIDVALLKDNGLHLHVPAGAIPKDGPSAGVTMLTAIASLLLQQPVRTDTAMTGEIDLSGDVLPIGGLREKVLAAHRAGIYRVLLPKQNEKDLVEIPEHVQAEMTFVGCDRIEQILHHALVIASTPHEYLWRDLAPNSHP